ncbi:putative inorganic phosphate cotransporter [Chionoecetes opilio]|uniref:Putative inorganic phosphate cotransporter n=1 Tax=Chionoecetes opilio TaxID=41210 RepID=A0A8J4YYI5_CHIOP|nr:putative inorganic phosphate cotransporter [Chionoecetes opilio]
MSTTHDANERTPALNSTRIRLRIRPRHTLALLGCLGTAISYCQRVNLSVAIVAMVSHNADNSTNMTYLCPNTTPHSRMIHAVPDLDTSPSEDRAAVAKAMPQEDGAKEFSWDKWTQGIVLGSFYWGYAVTSLFGGRISEYLGGKTVTGLGMFSASFLSLITPLAARASVQALITCRIFLGSAQGIVVPAMNTILASWFLPLERSKYTTIVISGCPMGAVVGMTVSGWLADSSFLGGWPSVFYCFGAAGIVWGMVWCLLVHSHPDDHPDISPELHRRLRDNQDSIKGTEVVAIPWMSLVSSLPLWGVIMASLGSDYGFYTLMAELPTYLNDVHGFDLTSNAMLSALPCLLMLLWSLVWAALMHTLSLRDIVSLVTVRRLSMATALYGPMLALLVVVFVQCNTVVAVCMICLAVMLSGSATSGYLCSHQDLAPNLAGTLMGLTNTVGALAGIASPAITGYIVGEIKTEWAWRIVFLISVGLFLVTCTFYLLLIAASVQPWNDPPGFYRVRLRHHEAPAARRHVAD